MVDPTEIADTKQLALLKKQLEEERRKRETAEEVLHEEKQRYERLLNTIPCALYDYVRWPDGSSRFLYISPQCKDIFEHGAERVMKDEALLWSMVHPDDLERLHSKDQQANRSGKMFQEEVRIVLPSGGIKWIQLTSRPSQQKLEHGIIWSGVIFDVTDRRTAEDEREKLIIELRDSLEEVKTLNGLLPICAQCKKIRDDSGYWKQIETYLEEHSEASFSHGTCPQCEEKLYGDQPWFQKLKKKRTADKR